MAFDSTNTSGSFFIKTVELQNWWLTKTPGTQYDNETLIIGVAGVSQQNGVGRCFYSAPILKVTDYFELETVDGVFVILRSFIDKERTLENGFSPEVFEHFIFGFPLNWKQFATSSPEDSAAKCVARGLEFPPHEDGKVSIEGHADFHDRSPSKSQQSDIYTVDMEVQDCEDTILNNKTATVSNASSYETPQEHLVKAGHEIPGKRSPVTSEYEADSSPLASPIVGKAANSSTPKRLRVSSRRMTRSMTKVDISKTNSPLLNDISNLNKVALIDPDITEDTRNKSTSQVGISNQGESKDADAGRYDSKEKETTDLSKANVSIINSKRKQNDQNVDDTRKKLTFQVGISSQRKSKEAGVSSESQIGIRKCDLRPKLNKSGCSDPFTNTSVGVVSSINASTGDINFASGVIAENDNAVPSRTNMKGCQNKGKGQEGVASKAEIGSEKVITRSKSRGNLKSPSLCHGSPKTQLKASPKTHPQANKASKEECGSEYTLSPESLSGKKSRSGRVLLPKLEFWRNQRKVFDENGEVCGVEERV
uniref:uncharacterized protein LOC122584657 n=1 Tax=Erigeron canadensis TaxID=72917 RepID=UPI001CB92D69|nr:uncharacterized protein LOC122584657 [Erigeron canadensis]